MLAVPPGSGDVQLVLKAEDLKFGPLGAQLAEECRQQEHAHWLCPQLAHNQPELARLNASVRPFLFSRP